MQKSLAEMIEEKGNVMSYHIRGRLAAREEEKEESK